MINELWFALWFFLPAGIANATPVFAKKVPLLNRWTTPLDFGKSWRGKRLFGANKTWRGLVFGTLVGALTSLIIYLAYPDAAHQLDFAENQLLRMLLLGGLLGVGALLGDSIESMVKRQLGIAPGEPWFPFDQIDYIIGGLVFSSLLVTLEPLQNVTILLVYFGLHLVSSYIGYLLNLKDKPL